MYYGQPRFTEHIDFIAVTGHMDVLAANPATMERHHFAPACTYKLYHQSGMHVDLWKDEFADEIVKRAVDVELSGRACRIVERHDLIVRKLRARRLKDDADISEIIKNEAIDETRLQSLVTPAQFDHFLQINKRT